MNKYLDLFVTFFKIGAFTLGGGFAMLPLIEREVVDNKEWIEEEEMVDVVALSQSIPGGIAINASTIVGYKVGGVLGSISAIVGVALPSFVSIMLIAIIFAQIGDLSIVEAAFKGIRATVVALIIIAAHNFGKTVIKDFGSLAICIVALILLLIVEMSAIQIIMLGALIGCALYFILGKGKGAER